MTEEYNSPNFSPEAEKGMELIEEVRRLRNPNAGTIGDFLAARKKAEEHIATLPDGPEKNGLTRLLKTIRPSHGDATIDENLEEERAKKTAAELAEEEARKRAALAQKRRELEELRRRATSDSDRAAIDKVLEETKEREKMIQEKPPYRRSKRALPGRKGEPPSDDVSTVPDQPKVGPVIPGADEKRDLPHVWDQSVTHGRGPRITTDNAKLPDDHTPVKPGPETWHEGAPLPEGWEREAKQPGDEGYEDSYIDKIGDALRKADEEGEVPDQPPPGLSKAEFDKWWREHKAPNRMKESAKERWGAQKDEWKRIRDNIRSNKAAEEAATGKTTWQRTQEEIKDAWSGDARRKRIEKEREAGVSYTKESIWSGVRNFFGWIFGKKEKPDTVEADADTRTRRERVSDWWYGTSTLTPDVREWIKSQGDKFPNDAERMNAGWKAAEYARQGRIREASRLPAARYFYRASEIWKRQHPLTRRVAISLGLVVAGTAFAATGGAIAGAYGGAAFGAYGYFAAASVFRAVMAGVTARKVSDLVVQNAVMRNTKDGGITGVTSRKYTSGIGTFLTVYFGGQYVQSYMQPYINQVIDSAHNLFSGSSSPEVPPGRGVPAVEPGKTSRSPTPLPSAEAPRFPPAFESPPKPIGTPWEGDPSGKVTIINKPPVEGVPSTLETVPRVTAEPVIESPRPADTTVPERVGPRPHIVATEPVAVEPAGRRSGISMKEPGGGPETEPPPLPQRPRAPAAEPWPGDVAEFWRNHDRWKY